MSEARPPVHPDDAWERPEDELATPTALIHSLARVTCVSAVSLVILGAVVLFGWGESIERLKDPLGRLQYMMPSTALMLIACGLSLWLARSAAAPRRRRWPARALAAACGVMAILFLLQDILDRDVGARVATPSMPSLMAFALASAALLTLDVNPRRGPRPAEILSGGAAIIGSLTVGGYLYGAMQFYVARRHPHATGMAIHAGVAFVVLAIGIWAARPSSGLMAIVTSPLVGGLVVRRMVFVVLSIPVLGFFAVLAQRAGLYQPPGAAVVDSVAGMVAASVVALVVGRSLNDSDARRRRVEAESREWKRFFDRATFGAVCGSGHGRFRHINEAFARMHGRTVEELVGTPVVDVFAPHRRAELDENIRIADERGHCRWESEHLRKDGSVFPVVIDLSVVRDEQGRLRHRVAYIQDITEEKKAEVVRARLASLVQSADDAIIAKALDGTVLDWNRGAERIYGYTAQEMIGRPITTIVPADRLAEWATNRARVKGGEIVVSFETVRVRKDGQRIPIALTVSPIRDSVGRVVGISTIERDISHAKQREAELREARERELAHHKWLEAVIEHTPEAILILDEQGSVVRQNAASAALANGAGPPDLRGQPLPHDVRSPSGERLSADLIPPYRALLHGETTIARELALLAPSGELVPVMVSAAPVDVGGARRGAIAIFRDIRASKQLEREREEWSSVVAHDLRQPVAAVRLAAEMLAQEEQGPSAQRAVTRIRKAGERLERMIADLLDVSRLESSHLVVRHERVDIPTLIAEVLDLAPAIAVRCRTEIDPEARYVWADTGRLIQVMSNLLSNADKYSFPGTFIEVRAEPCGEMVKLSVVNEGPGIAPDEMPKLFSRFARTRSAHSGDVPGLGLGLYICHGLVEALGGNLCVESVPGDKTCFQLTVPQARALEEKLSA